MDRDRLEQPHMTTFVPEQGNASLSSTR